MPVDILQHPVLAHATLERLIYSDTGLEPDQRDLLINLLTDAILEDRERRRLTQAREVRDLMIVEAVTRLRASYPDESTAACLERLQSLIERLRHRPLSRWILSECSELEIACWFIIGAVDDGVPLPGIKQIRRIFRKGHSANV